MGFKTIIKLMDIKTFVAGLVPVILGLVYSKYAFGPVPISIYHIVVLVPVVLIYPFKLIRSFLSYEKSISTKGKSMGLIGQVGLKYHLSVTIGLQIAIIF